MKFSPISAPNALFLCAFALVACGPTGPSNRANIPLHHQGLPVPDGTLMVAEDVDPLIVGDRLMAAGEAELALRAYSRAAQDQGLTLQVLAAFSAANTKLGRFGQAQTYIDQALDQDPNFVPALNNKGVILLSQGATAEASRVFQRAFALDNGNSDAVRANLTRSLAILENSSYKSQNEPSEFSLERRGKGKYMLLSGV